MKKKIFKLYINAREMIINLYDNKGNSKKRRILEQKAELVYEDVKEATSLINKWYLKAHEANEKVKKLFRWTMNEIRRDYVKHYEDEEVTDEILWWDEYRIINYDVQYAERVLLIET